MKNSKERSKLFEIINDPKYEEYERMIK